MKTFKYRIWDRRHELWVQDDGDLFNSPDGQLIHIGNGFMNPVDDILWKKEPRYITQYTTGLLDKNGKEIYEGDMVKTTGVGACFVLQDLSAYTAGRVTWLRESWCLCQENVGGNPMHEYVECYCHPCYSLEVIGNMFENLELLT